MDLDAFTYSPRMYMVLFFTFISNSYAFALQITEQCLLPILQLPHLEDLVLEGCLGIDDDGLASLKHGCKSIKVHLFLISKMLSCNAFVYRKIYVVDSISFDIVLRVYP